MFGVAEEAAFTHLAVQGNIEAEDSVGGLVGVAAGGSFIDLHTDVRVISHNSGSGGLIGWTDNAEAGPLVIEDCSVSGDIDDLACCTGGVTGWLDDGSTVRNTHVHSDVFSVGCCSGGLFGWTQGSTVIEGCSMSGKTTDGCCLTGGIAGWFGVDTEVRDTVARGDVECGHLDQGCCSGGVTWTAFGDSVIENTHATGDVFDHFGIAGGFIAEMNDDIVITDSSAHGTVTVDGDNGMAGGFAGAIWFGTVTDSVAVGDVSSNGENGPVGGFVGYLDTEGNAERTAAGGNVDSEYDLVGGHAGVIYNLVRQSLATGSVTSTGDAVGGFAGLVTETGTVEQAYSWGHAAGGDLVGGFAGVHEGDTIDEVYSVGIPSATDGQAVGGLVAFADSTITDSYWDAEASATSVSDAGTPLTTDQMTDTDAIDNMVRFDFAGTWRTRDDDYPIFGWQGLVADEECIPRRHASRDTPDDLICPDDRVLRRSDVDDRGRRSRPTDERRDRSRDDS